MRNFLLLIFLAWTTYLQAQWTTQNSGTSAFLTNVFFPTADVGYFTKDNGGIYKTVNGGNNWAQISPANSGYNIFFTSKDTGFAVIDSSIKKTYDGAGSWNKKFSGGDLVFYGLFFPSKDTGYATAIDNANNNYNFYKTTDAGETWNFQGFIPSLTAYLGCLYFTNNITGYLAVQANIYKTIDGGSNWTEQYFDSLANEEIFSVFFPSPDTGFAAGVSGIYTTFDAGETWSSQPTPDGNLLYSVFFLTKKVGFVVGGNGFNSGSVYKTNDAGNTWFQSTSQIQTFNSIYFPNDTTGYAVGTNGAVIKYFNPDSVPLDTNHSNFVIGDLGLDKKIELFPNPTKTGRFSPKGLNNWIGNYRVTVTNLLGETILKSPQQLTAHSENQTIDISIHPRGIYFVKIETGEEVSVQKIIYQ